MRNKRIENFGIVLPILFRRFDDSKSLLVMEVGWEVAVYVICKLLTYVNELQIL